MRLKFDKFGRITIPSALRKQYHIGDEVYIFQKENGLLITSYEYVTLETIVKWYMNGTISLEEFKKEVEKLYENNHGALQQLNRGAGISTENNE